MSDKNFSLLIVLIAAVLFVVAAGIMPSIH